MTSPQKMNLLIIEKANEEKNKKKMKPTIMVIMYLWNWLHNNQ